MLVEWLLLYLALGLVVGFFAGLFGIGGGLILVPVLFWWFELQQLSDHYALQLALGTSMAAIVLSASYSSYAHHQHQAVNWKIVSQMSPGLLLGTLAGSSLASSLASRTLSLFFVIFVCIAAIQMLFNIRPTPTRQLTNGLSCGLAACFIGCISSLVSIGGGVLSVPYLLYHNVNLRQAIGTSAALGLPIAIGGSAGYIINGFIATTTLNGAIGFVYWPALLMLGLGSLITTPMGAKATHRLPLKILRPAFALLLLALAGKMLWSHH